MGNNTGNHAQGQNFMGSGCEIALLFKKKYILFFLLLNLHLLNNTSLSRDMVMALFVYHITKTHMTMCAFDLIPIYKTQIKIKEWKTSLRKYLMFLNHIFLQGFHHFFGQGYIYSYSHLETRMAWFYVACTGSNGNMAEKLEFFF